MPPVISPQLSEMPNLMSLSLLITISMARIGVSHPAFIKFWSIWNWVNLNVPYRIDCSVYVCRSTASHWLIACKTWDYNRDIARKLKLLPTPKGWGPERGYSRFVKEIRGSSKRRLWILGGLLNFRAFLRHVLLFLAFLYYARTLSVMGVTHLYKIGFFGNFKR